MQEPVCNTHEEIAAEARRVQEWFEEYLAKDWNRVEYNNPDVRLSELPSVDSAYLTRCRVHCHCSYESMFNFNYNARIEDMKAYDKSMLSYEVFDRVPNTEIVVTETSFSVVWPVTSRQFVSVHNNYSTANGHVFVQSSILNDKVKTNSKCVLAFKRSGMLIERDPNDSEWCFVERIIMMDPRGSIPTFIANKYKTNDAERLLELASFVIKLERSGKIQEFVR